MWSWGTSLQIECRIARAPAVPRGRDVGNRNLAASGDAAARHDTGGAEQRKFRPSLSFAQCNEHLLFSNSSTCDNSTCQDLEYQDLYNQDLSE